MPRATRDLLFAVGIFLFCFLLQNVPVLVERATNIPLKWNITAKTVTTDISNLPSKDYYVSLGRPRAHCDILLDDHPIFIGRSSIHDKRPSLMVGAGFRGGQTKKLHINCDHYQSGFKNYLTHAPYIGEYSVGVTVHNLRAISEILLGPISSILLMAILLALSFMHGSSVNWKDWSFALTSFIYALSLSYLSRIYIQGHTASVAHVVLRYAFSIAAYLLLSSRSRIRTAIPTGILLLGCTLLAHTHDASALFTHYKITYPFLVLPTLCSLWDQYQHQPRSKKDYFFRVFTWGWLLCQILDTINFWANTGIYSSPMFIMLFALSHGITSLESSMRQRADQILSKKISDIGSALTNPRQSTQDLLSLLKDFIPFSKASAYLDGYYLGESPRATERFLRISESAEASSSNAIVDFNEGHGMIMCRAINEQKVIIGQDDTRGWYLVCPIGKSGCLNFSHGSSISSYAAFESFETLSGIKSALESLSARIVDRGVSQNGSLQKLRLSVPEGSYDAWTGALFVDVVDYTKHTEMYGNAFPSFVSSILFPALTKFLKEFALPEAVRGDEIYFVTAAEDFKDKDHSQKNLQASVERLSTFSKDVLPGLCSDNGFPLIDFRTGISFGEGTIVVDNVQVRTSGDHINRAKRLQESAGRGEIIVDATIFDECLKAVCVPISRKTIVVKKNTVEVVKVGVKRAA